MSKNHPNDNIYSILGKLDALKPTQEEKRFALVKEIRDSVEAKGSITEGVCSVEAKLQKQFNEAVVEKAPPGAKAERMVKDIKKSLSKDGHLSDKDKAIAYATTWKAHNKGQVEEDACCESCGMVEAECGCEHTNEAEITRTPGKTVHRKTDFPGYPVDEPEDIEDTNKGKRGRPRKHAAKAPTGLGRGRPKKAAAVGSTAPKMHDPFGRVAHGASKLAGTKGRVHSLDEAMDLVQQNLTEGRYLEDTTGESFNHILNRFRTEVRNFEQGGDLDNDLYDALYDYYVECGEMPYGVQKARTGDPMRWVAEKLEAELGDIAYGKDPANAEGAGLEMEAGIPGSLPPEQIPGKEDLLKGKGRSYYEEEVTMEDELNELAKLAGLNTTEGNAFTGKLANTPKGGEFELDGKTFKDTSALGETDLEEEDESPKADKDYDQDGEVESEKDEVIGSRRKAAGLDEGTSFDSDDTSDFNISTSMSSDGDKNVTVTATGEHAANLLQMLRIAGLGGTQAAQDLEQSTVSPGNMEEPEAEVVVIGEPEEVVDEEGVEVDQPKVAPQNAPNEKYGTIKNITTQGDDLNREKKQDPGTANKAANPMTNAQQVLKAVAQLESKLAEEYESIKKVSK